MSRIKNNLSFKINSPTGPYASFNHAWVDIKQNKKVIGSINYAKYLNPKPEDVEGFQIGLMIKGSPKNNPNCPWRWIHFKRKFDKIDEAKQWVKENWEKICNTYELVSQDN